MRISTQNIVCSQCWMYTCIHHSVIHYKHTTSNLSVNKAAEHLINSTLVLEKKKRKRKKATKKKRKAVNAYKEWGGGGGGGGGHCHKQSEGLGGVLCHRPSYVTTSRCA